MPTLYVENVPVDLYEALRERARERRKSISAEVLALLEEAIPTSAELKRRRQFLERARKLRAKRPPTAGPFPTAVEMLREDRRR